MTTDTIVATIITFDFCYLVNFSEVLRYSA